MPNHWYSFLGINNLIIIITSNSIIFAKLTSLINMSKSFLLIVLIILSLGSFAQQENDSLYYDDYYTKDTNSTTHFGLSVGMVIQALIYSTNNTNCICDSISAIGSKPNIGYNIGIVFDKDISKKMWIHTGFQINISKLNLLYSKSGNEVDYSFSYSTLEFPLWLNRSFNNKSEGMAWGGGLSPSIDISKKSDRTLRDFTLNRFELLLGTGPSWRWQLPSGSFVSTNLVFNIGLFNIFDTDAKSVYNNVVKSGRRYQIQFFISLN